MKVISIAKNADLASIALAGCPMKCGYCMHVRQDRKDMTMEKVISEVCTSTIRKVYVGGMDPLVHQKEIGPFVHTLKQRGLEVSLKTSGHYPEQLRQLLPYLDKVVFEIKAPLDDVGSWKRLSGQEMNWVEGYLKNLQQSLDISKGKNIKIMTRAIPGFVNDEVIERIGRQLHPYAREATLSQFLGNRMNDFPFFGITEASPPEADIERYGRILAKHILLVKVNGAGFERTITL